MHAEPEAVSEETQRQISVEARARFSEARADELTRADAKRWGDRLRRVEMRARSKGVTSTAGRSRSGAPWWRWRKP
jgi:hypothetical protein